LLNLVRLSGFDRALPRIDPARQVIRMHDVVGGPTLQFLSRLAEILQELLIDEFVLGIPATAENRVSASNEGMTKGC
jgi:hypothetical protein